MTIYLRNGSHHRKNNTHWWKLKNDGCFIGYASDSGKKRPWVKQEKDCEQGLTRLGVGEITGHIYFFNIGLKTQSFLTKMLLRHDGQDMNPWLRTLVNNHRCQFSRAVTRSG